MHRFKKLKSYIYIYIFFFLLSLLALTPYPWSATLFFFLTLFDCCIYLFFLNYNCYPELLLLLRIFIILIYLFHLSLEPLNLGRNRFIYLVHLLFFIYFLLFFHLRFKLIFRPKMTHRAKLNFLTIAILSAKVSFAFLTRSDKYY